MKSIHLLGGEKPLTKSQENESCLYRGWRVSRRYSIVASEVSLLALNIIFLITKADSNIPKEVGNVTLFCLSAIGVLFLHYSVDVIWKSMGDTRFAVRVRNRPIMALAAIKIVHQLSSVALTLGNASAATAGIAGYGLVQKRIYKDITVWGEVSLGVGLALTGLSILTTYYVHRQLKKEQDSAPLVAAIRYSMDKDTMWKVSDQLRVMSEEDDVSHVMQIIKDNVATQLKVTLGGKVLLIVIGDALQAVEKVYTPDSLVSAVINCSVSSLYTIKIVVEKGLEYRQRARLEVKTQVV